MAEISDNIGLELPIKPENFSTDLVNRNYKRIDKSIGLLGGGNKPFSSRYESFISSNLDNLNVAGNGNSYFHRFGNIGYWHIEGNVRSKLEGGGSGNIANTVLGTIAERHRPAAIVPVQTVNVGPLLMGYIGVSGDVRLTAIPPGVTISVGDIITLGGWGYIK